MRLVRYACATPLTVVILCAAVLPARAQELMPGPIIEEVESAIGEMLAAGRVPSATVALVAGDRIVWTGAFGLANIWAQTPARVETVYLIGSTFKAMSTFALLQQMEQGRFALDDRVSDYLTEFTIRGEDPSNPILFRHLLTHTSGLPPAFGPYMVWSDSVPPPLDEYLARDLEVVSPPMDSVRYSNIAFTLVAYLVEKFSGTPYRQYMQANIFDRLEMRNTAFDPTPSMDERLAVPYVVDANTGRHTPAPRLRAAVWPAGIVYGTVTDQANWLIANLNGGEFNEHQFISDRTLDEMHTRQWDEFAGPMEDIGFGNETTGYGLTWWTTERNGDRYFAHSGSVPGYTAFLLGNRSKKLGFAILTNGNRAHPHLVKLAERAVDLLAEAPVAAGR